MQEPAYSRQNIGAFLPRIAVNSGAVAHNLLGLEEKMSTAAKRHKPCMAR